jgi:hypothetical protein
MIFENYIGMLPKAPTLRDCPRPTREILSYKKLQGYLRTFARLFYVHLVQFCFALSNPVAAFVGPCVLGNFSHKKYEKDVENMMIMLTRESPKGTPVV